MEIIEKHNLDQIDLDRIVNMAWEDRTPFDAIEMQFGVSEGEVIKIMKHQMTLKNWKKWRERVQGRKTKHSKLRVEGIDRHKCQSQRTITTNRISKKKY